MSKCLCLVPVKVSSKRLAKKNLLPIRNRPMMLYALEAAKKSQLFGDDIWISTESEEASLIAKHFGVRVHQRPEELARDPATVCDVILDFLMKNQMYQTYDYLFVLQANSPMILPIDLIKAYDIYRRLGVENLFSVSELEHSAFRAVLVNDGLIDPILPEKIKFNSKDLPTTYRLNGALAILNIKSFLINKTWHIYPCGAYIMPRERGIDVDTKFDYLLAKALMENEEIWQELIKTQENI